MTFNRDDLPSLFGGGSDADKRETFERSTLKLVLGQIGWDRSKVLAADAETAFNWDWFNEGGFIRARVGSTREFRFNFEQLVTKPAHHEIVEAFRVFKGDSEEPCCLVFHVYEHGRWVATNLATANDTSIHIATDAGTLKFNVLPFAKFFSNRWGIP